MNELIDRVAAAIREVNADAVGLTYRELTTNMAMAAISAIDPCLENTMRKYIICYLGVGNCLVHHQEFPSKTEAVAYLERADFSNGSLSTAHFLIIEAWHPVIAR
jgi:hypothetical protein